MKLPNHLQNHAIIRTY